MITNNKKLLSRLLSRTLLVIIVYGILLGNVLGIIRFVKCDFASPYKAEVLYGIGIPTGLNTILGYINLGK